MVESKAYVVGAETPLVIPWAAFTFSPTSPCNDGTTIPFPTNYAGTWARTVPDTAFTDEEAATPPITIETIDNVKSWKVNTDAKTYLGTYKLTLTASYGGTALTKAQVIELTIQEECEPPTVTLPDLKDAKYSWTPGKAPLTIKVPVLTVVPSTCAVTYVVSIPEKLEGIAKVDTETGDIKVSGAASPSLAGAYEFVVQGKTPAGELIPNSKFTLDFTLGEQKKKPAGDLVSQITTVAGTAATAAFRPRPPVQPSGSSIKPTVPKPAQGTGTGAKASGKIETGKGPAGGAEGGPTGKGEAKTKAGGENFDVDTGAGGEGADDFGGGDFGEGETATGEESTDAALDFQGVESFDFSI